MFASLVNKFVYHHWKIISAVFVAQIIFAGIVAGLNVGLGIDEFPKLMKTPILELGEQFVILAPNNLLMDLKVFFSFSEALYFSLYIYMCGERECKKRSLFLATNCMKNEFFICPFAPGIIY